MQITNAVLNNSVNTVISFYDIHCPFILILFVTVLLNCASMTGNRNIQIRKIQKYIIYSSKWNNSIIHSDKLIYKILKYTNGQSLVLKTRCNSKNI